MRRYEELHKQRRIINHKIKKHEKKLHNKLVKEYRIWFWCMDIAVILLVLMNFGAVFMTNILVMRAEPDRQIVEANPIQAEMNDFQTHPKAQQMFYSVIRQIGIWSVILFFYIIARFNVYKKWHLIVMLSFVGYYFILCGYDFFNNLGYYIGVLLYR